MPQNIPRGTHIVLTKPVKTYYGEVIPVESVGVVQYDAAMNDGLLVHFTNDRHAYIRSDCYRVRRLPDMPDPVPTDYDQYLVYRSVIGSRAYGLAHEDSDYDFRGVYLPPASLNWSLYGTPDIIEHKDPDQCYWEYGRFIHLALKANPNILEVLWSPLVVQKEPLFEELYENRTALLSKVVYQTYSGYAISQFKKIEDDIRLHNEIRWKHASHLVRLLMSGIELMKSGQVIVDVGDWRDRLLDIRHGRIAWESINDWKNELQMQFEAAMVDTKLPAKPDYERVNRILLNARRAMVD